MKKATELQLLQRRYAMYLRNALGSTWSLHNVAQSTGVFGSSSEHSFWPVRPEFIRVRLRTWYDTEKDKLIAKRKKEVLNETT